MKQLTEETIETLGDADELRSAGVREAPALDNVLTGAQTGAPSTNGSAPAGLNDPPEVHEARKLALRYRLPFVNLLPARRQLAD